MITAARSRRHRLIGQGNHSRVYRYPDSRVVLQIFEPDAPELTVTKVRYEYAYLRAVFDPVLPELVPAQRLLLAQPDAPLAEAIMVKDYIDVTPAWSLRTVSPDALPSTALEQLRVFVDVVRGLLADTATVPAFEASAAMIPDFIDPPLNNLVVDTSGALRLLDTNRLISTLELRIQEQAGRVLTADRTDVPARIFGLMFRRLMFLQHRFFGASAAQLRADPLFTRYIHPAQFDALFAASAAAGEPIEP